jgi:hypothetical protein
MEVSRHTIVNAWTQSHSPLINNKALVDLKKSDDLETIASLLETYLQAVHPDVHIPHQTYGESAYGTMIVLNKVVINMGKYFNDLA